MEPGRLNHHLLLLHGKQRLWHYMYFIIYFSFLSELLTSDCEGVKLGLFAFKYVYIIIIILEHLFCDSELLENSACPCMTSWGLWSSTWFIWRRCLSSAASWRTRCWRITSKTTVKQPFLPPPSIYTVNNTVDIQVKWISLVQKKHSTWICQIPFCDKLLYNDMWQMEYDKCHETNLV